MTSRRTESSISAILRTRMKNRAFTVRFFHKQMITWAKHSLLVICSFILTLSANAAPTLDSFNPGANGSVWTMALQTDGKILVGGSFTTLGGQTRNRIGRLNADGTLDTDFNPEANIGVNSIAVQMDGKILIGGVFTSV